MWSGNFRNLHAYASLIFKFFFINTNYEIKRKFKLCSDEHYVNEQTIHVFDYFI